MPSRHKVRAVCKIQTALANILYLSATGMATIIFLYETEVSGLTSPKTGSGSYVRYRITKEVPFPRSDLTMIFPPPASTILDARERPMPTDSLFAFSAR